MTEESYKSQISFLVSATLLVGLLAYAPLSPRPEISLAELRSTVAPAEGVILPVVWGDMGARLVEAGAIDAELFVSLYESRGDFSDERRELLLGSDNGRLVVTRENAAYLLNLLWAFGLANKNPILESGEMMNPAHGGAHRFASTGGWRLAKGDAMNHYGGHELVLLTPEQQALVEKLAKGIYRPCCDNPTDFPDCNHGMAMLGLLELMASQGASEEEMWRAALAVNAYWFPDIYATIATYMSQQGMDWKGVRPQEVLGFEYSSASGFRNISSKVRLPRELSGGSCGA